MRFWVLAFILSFSTPLRAELGVDDEALILHNRQASKLRLDTGYDAVFATRRRGDEARVVLSYRYYKSDAILFGFSRESRLFEGSSTQADHSYLLAHAASLGKSAYVISSVTYSRNPDFSPYVKWSLEPHFVLKNEADLNLGIEQRLYDRSKSAVSLKAGWSIPVQDRYTFGVQFSFEVTPQFAAAMTESLEVRWLPRLSTKVFLAGGGEDAGDRLLDPFISFGGSIGYHIFIPLVARVTSSRYIGELRTEDRIGLSFEYRL